MATYLIVAGICLLVFGLIAFAIYLLWLEHNHQTLLSIIEDKFQPDKMSHAEKKSRQRVTAIIKSHKAPMQKCVELDAEMALIRTQITVSKHWKQIVESLFKDTMQKNSLSLRSNRRGGTYIISTINKGEFSKCLQMY